MKFFSKLADSLILLGSNLLLLIYLMNKPSRLWSMSPGRFLWTGTGPGWIPCFRAPMLSDFRGGPVLPAAATGSATSPLVNCCLLGQANCKRYSVLILEIALLNWLDGIVDVAVTSWKINSFSQFHIFISLFMFSSFFVKRIFLS